MTNDVNYKGPGRYRHYKGGEYEVLGCGQPEALGIPQKFEYTDVWEGKDLQVVYRPLVPDPEVEAAPFTFWLRPLDDFNGWVLSEGEDGMVPRFRLIA